MSITRRAEYAPATPAQKKIMVPKERLWGLVPVSPLDQARGALSLAERVIQRIKEGDKGRLAVLAREKENMNGDYRGTYVWIVETSNPDHIRTLEEETALLKMDIELAKRVRGHVNVARVPNRLDRLANNLG